MGSTFTDTTAYVVPFKILVSHPQALWSLWFSHIFNGQRFR